MSGGGEAPVPKRIGIFRGIAVLRYSQPQVGDVTWLRPRLRAAAAGVVLVMALGGWALLAR